MNKLIPILVTTAILAVLLFSTFKTAFKNNKFTCSKYILNTYLYILLSFIFITLLVLMLDYYKINLKFNWVYIIGIFLMSLAVLMFTLNTNPKNVLLKHLLWLTFIMLMGLIFYPSYKIHSSKNLISALITTISLVIILSIIAFVKPEWISLNLGPVLFILLVAGIILELTSIYLGGHRDRKSYIYKGFMYFFIVLFSLYILYDTKLLQIRAKACVNPDYINESLNLFLDIANIFVRMLALGGSN